MPPRTLPIGSRGASPEAGTNPASLLPTAGSFHYNEGLMKTSRKDAPLFLKALREEGIEEIYLPLAKAASLKTPTAKLENETSSRARETLLKFREQVLPCTLCSELAAKRKNVVFGAGSANAKLMFVGEAPGHDEDLQGLPFVGQAGQLLTKIIESIGLTRQEVFIANVLKCRPPGNRQPHPEEILNCRPYLLKQIEIIQPKIICALGSFAAQTLLESANPISQLRGKFHEKNGVKIICTFHPAYLLRNPGEKRKVWEDMKTIRRELDALS